MSRRPESLRSALVFLSDIYTKCFERRAHLIDMQIYISRDIHNLYIFKNIEVMNTFALMVTQMLTSIRSLAQCFFALLRKGFDNLGE